MWGNTFNRFDPASPFGGYKESGFGREGGRHGLEAYLRFDDGGVGTGRGDRGEDRASARSSGASGGVGERKIAVRKTYKLFIGGAFPRSESGRTLELEGYNVARASRKDAREAVVAARKAFGGWSAATAYNRGQVLYRLAETMETRSGAFAAACSGRREVARAIDRVVWYAGWADKLAQVLGSANPVAGPYFNFTIPEPTGVVAIVAPTEPALDGLVARLAPAVVGGNAVVVLASDDHPLAAIELAEAVATSDVPGGVVNVLTGLRSELAPILAAHMDVNAIDVTGRGRRRGRAGGARRGERQAGRAGAGGSQPVGDRFLHGAEDRLAPDRALSCERRLSRRTFLRGTPTHHPLPILSASLPFLATKQCQRCAAFVTTSSRCRPSGSPVSPTARRRPP